jgi:hypothetical protein
MGVSTLELKCGTVDVEFFGWISENGVAVDYLHRATFAHAKTPNMAQRVRT